MKYTKFVAHTEEAGDSHEGKLIAHVITPVDTTAIPLETRRAFRGDPQAQVIDVAVNPERLDEIIGVFASYEEAATALRNCPWWRATGTPTVREDRFIVVNQGTKRIVSRRCPHDIAERILEWFSEGADGYVFTIEEVPNDWDDAQQTWAAG